MMRMRKMRRFVQACSCGIERLGFPCMKPDDGLELRICDLDRACECQMPNHRLRKAWLGNHVGNFRFKSSKEFKLYNERKVLGY